MKTIAVVNNKGGSAKTTTTVSLAAAFAERGLRVLVVDLDPQGSATEWLGGREQLPGLIEFSTGDIRLVDLAVASTEPGVDLVPTSPGLTQLETRTTTEIGLALMRAFSKLPDNWDLVLIDTPPSVGYLSLVPIVVSDHLLIPVEAHALALPGVAGVLESMELAKRNINPRVTVLGVLICRVNATMHSREVIARLYAQLGSMVLDHGVRDAIRIAEAPAFQLPITRYAPESKVANDYRLVAGELLDRLGIDGARPTGQRA